MAFLLAAAAAAASAAAVGLIRPGGVVGDAGLLGIGPAAATAALPGGLSITVAAQKQNAARSSFALPKGVAHCAEAPNDSGLLRRCCSLDALCLGIVISGV